MNTYLVGDVKKKKINDKKSRRQGDLFYTNKLTDATIHVVTCHGLVFIAYCDLMLTNPNFKCSLGVAHMHLAARAFEHIGLLNCN